MPYSGEEINIPKLNPNNIVRQYQCPICKQIYTSVGVPLDDVGLQRCKGCKVVMEFYKPR